VANYQETKRRIDKWASDEISLAPDGESASQRLWAGVSMLELMGHTGHAKHLEKIAEKFDADQGFNDGLEDEE
jgi:hypothetical protein